MSRSTRWRQRFTRAWSADLAAVRHAARYRGQPGTRTASSGHGTQPRNVRLNNASVAPHASFAAFSSNRGVVSLLKPCCVPG